MIERLALDLVLERRQGSHTGALMNSSEDLIARARAGDHEAFRLIFERHAHPVLGFLYGLVGQRDLAEELTQETFVRAYRKLKQLRDDSKFSTWLFGISRNLAREALRARQRDNNGLTNDRNSTQEREDLSSASPSDRLLGKELNIAMRTALGLLDEDKRLVFTLKVFQQRSYQEIAEITGYSLAKVKTDLHRARGEMRRRIRPYLETKWMKCEECLLVIEEYFDGELDESIKEAIRLHIGRCVACTTALHELGAEQEAYAVYQPDLGISPELWAGVRARIVGLAPTPSAAWQERLGRIPAGPRVSAWVTAGLVLMAVGLTVLVMNSVKEENDGLTAGSRNVPATIAIPERLAGTVEARISPEKPNDTLVRTKNNRTAVNLSTSATAYNRRKPAPAVEMAPRAGVNGWDRDAIEVHAVSQRGEEVVIIDSTDNSSGGEHPRL